MKLEIFEKETKLKIKIKDCQHKNHVQQVAFSTYHNCFTQVCYTCMAVRTTMSKEEMEE